MAAWLDATGPVRAEQSRMTAPDQGSGLFTSRQGWVYIDVRSADLPAPHTAPWCTDCPAQSTVGHIGRAIRSDGSTALRWVCNHCGHIRPGDLPATLLGEEPLERVPIVEQQPAREDAGDWPTCVVCDQPAADFHHWSPRSIFPDWPEHLGAHLCTRHHDEWHDKLRQHGLRWPHETGPE